MIDYPGKVSCVIFTQGCNFYCPYCHNPDLISLDTTNHGHTADSVLSFLDKRTKLLDGVVISGGEPTLQKNLAWFCKKIKEKGFQIKLDTNGSRPHVLKMLLSEGLVDYMAMDIKTVPTGYSQGICKGSVMDDIELSVGLIMDSVVSYEFRTTCVKPFVDVDKIKTIGELIRGASLYALQEFCGVRVYDREFVEGAGWFETADLERLQAAAAPYVKQCVLR